MANASALQQWQRTPGSVRRRPSLCPPVGPSALPAMNRRGPGQRPCATAALIPPVGAAGVAYGREAALQHAAHRVHRARRHEGQRNALEPAERDLAQHHVDVAVDQAGHQRSPAAIDDLGRGRRNRPVRHLLDEPVLDQQLEPGLKLVPRRIQHLEVAEEVLGQAPSPDA
jgi:hypothetical protein